MRIHPFGPSSGTSRRRFLQATSAASIGALSLSFSAKDQTPEQALPPPFSTLKPLGSRVRPITTAEFGERLQHAQQLMSGARSPAAQTSTEAAHYDALFFAPGSSLYYFTGIRWGLSERLLGLVIPRTGNPIIVVPAFEEGRLREKLHFPFEVRAWQEDESPTKLAAAALADRGIRAGRIGVEETVGFTFSDHLRHAAPELRVRFRRSHHHRLPRPQVRSRTRTDAAGLRRYLRRFPRGLRLAQRRHVAGRDCPTGRKRLRKDGLARRRAGPLGCIRRSPARHRETPNIERGRRRLDRWWMQASRATSPT